MSILREFENVVKTAKEFVGSVERFIELGEKALKVLTEKEADNDGGDTTSDDK